MQILSAASTDRGLRRETNEDSFSIRPTLGLFVVADGMGGHAAGEVASHIAADAIEAFVEHSAGWNDQVTWPYGFNPGLGVDGNRLTSAFLVANRQIQQRAQDEPALHGMATTAVALLLKTPAADGTRPNADGTWPNADGTWPKALALGSREPATLDALVAHVGDSRAYLWRDGKLEQITRDHSWVEEQVAAGTLTEDDARHHPWRNLVTRALAGTEDPVVDVTPLALEPGDRVLLCSDGLSTPVADAQISDVCAKAPAGDVGGLCSLLVAAANGAGGPDNITVVVIEVTKD